MTVSAGQQLALTIEKPAAGGWMIARSGGQIVLVDGAIPGERVRVSIDRVAKGVAYARTVEVEEASADRQTSTIDRACGGCLYAHIAYPRQLVIKSVVISDAFARIGRLQLPGVPAVAPSPVHGYRMRARLHRRGSRLGFFREKSHEVCNARATGQLLPATCDLIDRLESALDEAPAAAVREVEISENVDASERVMQLHGLDRPGETSTQSWAGRLVASGAITGLSAASQASGAGIAVFGSPYVSDPFDISGRRIAVKRHVSAFFQSNRFLVRDLVAHVAEQIRPVTRLLDLYAGGGVFALAAAAGGAVVTAVEGDRVAARDLDANATASGLPILAVHQAVEEFLVQGGPSTAEAVLLDPPRTGLSPEAVQGVARLGAASIVYVSCDVATLARDARRLVDRGYRVDRVDGFDMFPNTPHVEAVAVFGRR